MNKGQREANKISKALAKTIENLALLIQVKIRNGMSLDDAIDMALQETGFTAKLTNGLLSGLAVVEGKNIIATRQWWLDRKWKGESLSLSGKINDLTKLTDIKNSIRTSLRNAETWNKAARDLFKQNLQKADLAKHITTLIDNAKRVSGGNIKDIARYKASLRESTRAVNALAQNGAPNQRLKAAYQKVIDSTKAYSEKITDKAIQNLVKQKMSYNSERIIRTEMAKAYIQQSYDEALRDDQVIGMGYDLSDRHSITDICDFHTSVDLYGLGKGKYPLSHLPPYPFHPNCMCTEYHVYSGESTKINKSAGSSYLRELPSEKRKALLGTAGEREFRASAGTWEKNLRNYEGHKSIKVLSE